MGPLASAGISHDYALHSTGHQDLIDIESLFVFKKQIQVNPNHIDVNGT